MVTISILSTWLEWQIHGRIMRIYCTFYKKKFMQTRAIFNKKLHTESFNTEVSNKYIYIYMHATSLY